MKSDHDANNNKNNLFLQKYFNSMNNNDNEDNEYLIYERKIGTSISSVIRNKLHQTV
jgi:hypothetical protein